MLRSNLSQRSGISNLVAIGFASAVVLVVLGVVTLRLPKDESGDGPNQMLRVYCAAGVVNPVQQIADSYNREFGTNVEISRTGGSGELAGQIQTEFESRLQRGADLYITADEYLLGRLQKRKIVGQRFRIAEQKPVIAIAYESELKITGLSELVSDSRRRFGVASEQAAVGRMVRDVAERDGILDELESNLTTDSENVMTLAQALVIGSLDAVVVWDTSVAQINQANGSPVLKVACLVDSRDRVSSSIAIGVLNNADSREECLSFAQYLTKSASARSTFESFGYTLYQPVDSR